MWCAPTTKTDNTEGPLVSCSDDALQDSEYDQGPSGSTGRIQSQTACVTPETSEAGSKSCDCNGCSIGEASPTPFQPKESAIFSKFKRGQRTFVASWYNTFKWLTLCVKRNKVFCAYCRYAHSHGLPLQDAAIRLRSQPLASITTRRPWRSSTIMPIRPFTKKL